MNKHIVNVNGQSFIFYLNGKKLDVFTYQKNEPEKIDFKKFKYPDKIKDTLSKAILEMFKSELITDINNKAYGSHKQIKNALDKKLESIGDNNIKDLLKGVHSSEEYGNVIKSLNDFFDKKTENIETKKEIIESTIDYDLRTLFEKNGIMEYEISPYKRSTLIVYTGKNGIPHTIINNNPNMSVYDVIVKNLQFDYIHSENELDEAIKTIMEREEKTTYTPNDTISVNKMDRYMDEIVDYIKNVRPDISKIYGIKPKDNVIDGALILESNLGYEPIIINRDSYGKLTVDFPNKKAVDSKKNTTVEIKKDYSKEKLEEDLSVISNDSQIRVILSKLERNDILSSEEKRALITFIAGLWKKISTDGELTQIDNEFLNKLIQTELRSQIIYQIPELKDVCNEIIGSFKEEQSLNNESSDKVKRIEKPSDKNAFIEITLVTFLSGLLSGLFVYSFFKMFS